MTVKMTYGWHTIAFTVKAGAVGEVKRVTERDGWKTYSVLWPGMKNPVDTPAAYVEVLTDGAP